jgi:hypothetical protein
LMEVTTEGYRIEREVLFGWSFKENKWRALSTGAIGEELSRMVQQSEREQQRLATDSKFGPPGFVTSL